MPSYPMSALFDGPPKPRQLTLEEMLPEALRRAKQGYPVVVTSFNYERAMDLKRVAYARVNPPRDLEWNNATEMLFRSGGKLHFIPQDDAYRTLGVHCYFYRYDSSSRVWVEDTSGFVPVMNRFERINADE